MHVRVVAASDLEEGGSVHADDSREGMYEAGLEALRKKKGLEILCSVPRMLGSLE